MECAVRLDHRKPLILSDYADRLATIAADDPPSDPIILFQTAFDHFKLAIDLDPDSRYVDDNYDNWGVALLNYAERVPADQGADILEQAKDKFLRAESLKPGTSAYNLACVFARQGDSEQCRHWLEVAQHYQTLIPADEIREDPDLLSVRNEEWFTNLISIHDNLN
jgi:tetratricopeptide (TPR) repeat protein